MLTDKVAIVTGGGAGIGRAAACRLAERGARVVLAGRRREPLEAVAAEIGENGGTALAVPADLTKGADAEALVRRALDAYGRLDLAVNAAGGGSGVCPLVELGEATFDATLATNLRTTWLAMKFEIPAMAAAEGGAIVNISSRAGLVGARNGAAYAAAKHGVIGLTKSAALEAAPLGIRVNAICPGPTRTDQFAEIARQLMPGLDAQEAAARFGSRLPAGRIAEPDEVAAAALWLLGSDASYTTGAVLAVDGGGTAG